MAFALHCGNKLELLAAHCLESLYGPGNTVKDPFTPRTVVVPTRGMADYLTLTIAEKLPVAINISTPFVVSFIDSVLAASFPDFNRSGMLYNKEVLALRLYAILRDHPPEALVNFLNRAPQELRACQLALQLAGLFDQYQIYRPEKLRDWRERRTETDPRFQWQRDLYLELFSDGKSRDVFLQRFCELEQLAPYAAPDEITVFAVGSMPPLFFHFFKKLGDFRTVRFYYLNPCEDYWADQMNRFEARRRLIREELPPAGNPLLQSFGSYGREFFKLVVEQLDDFEEHFESYYTPGEQPDVLHAMQQDILRMRDRAANDDPFAAPEDLPFPVAPNDRSVMIHCCHNRRREIEILHDQLLYLLQSPEVQPRDILVMAPDINEYEPYIRAIFGLGPLEKFFSITDRSLREANPPAVVFEELLALPTSRFAISELFRLLDFPPVAQAFNLSLNERQRLQQLFARSGARWGMNAEHHREFTGVAFADFSWQDALDKLLLGFIGDFTPEVTTDPELLYNVPVPDEDDAILLGKGTDFLMACNTLRGQLKEKHTLHEWSQILGNAVEIFFASDKENATGLAVLREAVAHLADLGMLSNSEDLLPVDVIAELLSGKLEAPPENLPFLRGKIVFCSMQPMRSIPKKVVVLLGLNDRKFPRKDHNNSFSIINSHPKAGDRARDLEDRYLFLEALLSARRNLLLFYQGREETNNSPLPPAIPLEETLHYLENCFQLHPVNQKLQAFDREYFCPDRPKGMESFNRAAWRGASAFNTAERFAEEPRPRLQRWIGRFELPITVELTTLIRFFSDPVTERVKTLFGIRLAPEQEQPEDDEPFLLSAPDRGYLRRLILHSRIAGYSHDAVLRIARAQGVLPVGNGGNVVFSRVWHDVDALGDILTESAAQQPWRFALPLSHHKHKWLVEGTLNAALDRQSFILPGYGSWRWKNAVAFHLTGLALRATQNSLTPLVGKFISWQQETGFPIVQKYNFGEKTPTEARNCLLQLVRLYFAGLREPLPIFPQTMEAFQSGKGDFIPTSKFSQSQEDFSYGGDYECCPGIRYCYEQNFLSQIENNSALSANRNASKRLELYRLLATLLPMSLAKEVDLCQN